MTTPDPTPAGQPAPTASPDGGGAWTAVAKLLALQLLAVIAVTAVITGIYALAGGHGQGRATAGSSPVPTASTTATTRTSTPSTAPSTTPQSTAPASTSPASPNATQQSPAAAKRLKVDVFNESAPVGTTVKTAARIRALGWTVGRVMDFRGNVSPTTIYYPAGQAKAARELAAGLPGPQRVLPRFSTLSGSRLTIILTR